MTASVGQPLLGIAIGDALGMPFETMKHDHPTLTAWDGEEALPSTYLKLPPWSVTDDTQMSVLVAESLLAHQGWHVESTAKSYAAWYTSGDARGMGSATREALGSLSRGTPPQLSGKRGAVGSGTVMRAIPFGVFYGVHFDDPETPSPAWQKQELRRVTHEDAGITHQSFEAKEGAFLVAWIARNLVRGLEPVTNDLVRYVTRNPTSRPSSPCRSAKAVRDAITFVEGWRTHPVATHGPAAVRSHLWLALVEKAQAGISNGPSVSFGTGSTCYEVLGTALALLLSTETYEEAIRGAIRLGGDTDTRAAVVGGWAAITRPIPTAWVEQVENTQKLQHLDARLTRKEPR